MVSNTGKDAVSANGYKYPFFDIHLAVSLLCNEAI